MRLSDARHKMLVTQNLTLRSSSAQRATSTPVRWWTRPRATWPSGPPATTSSHSPPTWSPSSPRPSGARSTSSRRERTAGRCSVWIQDYFLINELKRFFVRLYKFLFFPHYNFKRFSFTEITLKFLHFYYLKLKRKKCLKLSWYFISV